MQHNWNEIVAKCKSGNRKGQKQLFSALLPYLNGVCKRYVQNQHDIQDVLQEVFINIFRSINQYDENKAHIKTWATRITINCCLQHNKKQTINCKSFEEENVNVAIQPNVLEGFNKNDLIKVLKKMPVDYYNVFNLYIIDGFSHKEIAKELLIEEALSRQRLVRAKKWIKTNFKEEEIFTLFEK